MQQSTFYLDTNLYIYLFEKSFPYFKRVKQLVETIQDNQHQIIASTLLLTEILVKPIKDKNQKLFDTYTKIDLFFPNFYWIQPNQAITIKAASLRANYNLKTPDAIHLATAINQQADYFVTADRRLTQIEQINIQLID